MAHNKHKKEEAASRSSFTSKLAVSEPMFIAIPT
jgi:hypothetical protein